MATRTTPVVLALIGLTAGCATEHIGDWTMETFTLQDSVHQIEVRVPMELDSFYTWVDIADNGCACRTKYRFSNSKLPIFQESGFKLELPDSSYRVTFSHYYYADCFGEWKADLDEMIAYYRNKAEQDSVDFQVFSAARIDINEIPFDVLAFKTDLELKQKYQSTLIWAFATIDSVELQVEYECALKNCDFFVEKMGESLRSIKELIAE